MPEPSGQFPAAHVREDDIGEEEMNRSCVLLDEGYSRFGALRLKDLIPKPFQCERDERPASTRSRFVVDGQRKDVES